MLLQLGAVRPLAGCDIQQGELAGAELLVAPAGAEKEADLPRRPEHRTAMKGLGSGQGQVRGNNLDFAAIIVKEEVRLGRAVHRGRLLRREDAGGQAAKQQSA